MKTEDIKDFPHYLALLLLSHVSFPGGDFRHGKVLC